MARVRIVHWKTNLAGPLVETVRKTGFEVEYDDTSGIEVIRMIRANPPDAVVFDLSCVPSHSREVAVYLRGTKYARRIPLIFVDGEPEKVAAVRALIPDATYTSLKRIRSAIKSACARPVENPVRPPGIMERYASRTAAQKLGIKEGSIVAVINAPRDYASAIGELPANADFIEDPEDAQPVTLWFVHDPGALQSALRRLRILAAKTKLWIVWRKGTGQLTDKSVRELANAANLVDYKICAVNSQWSAMAFARRKTSAQAEGSVARQEIVKGRILPRRFYERPTIEVARELLGKVLVHGPTAGIIVETEAYLGGGDLASHSAAGITNRTRVIFGPGGHAYVYLSYGMHDCMNIVAQPAGVPGCVLIRALEPIEGLDLMKERRKKARTEHDLTSGPGKLTQALAITRHHSGVDMTKGDLIVLTRSTTSDFEIAVTPRIGITKCADLPLRFLIAGNRFVSGARLSRGTLWVPPGFDPASSTVRRRPS